MARPNSYLDYGKINSAGIHVVSHCPVTCGLPTRMTEQGFSAACQAMRERGGDDPINTDTCKSSAQWSNQARKKLDVCAACKGNKRPEGLEIIPLLVLDKPKSIKQSLSKEKNMASNKVKGTCESCGARDLLLGKNYGIMMCSTCNQIHSHANNRGDVYRAAWNRVHQGSDPKDALIAVASTSSAEIATLKDQLTIVRQQHRDDATVIAKLTEAWKIAEQRLMDYAADLDTLNAAWGEVTTKLGLAADAEPQALIDAVIMLTQTMERYRGQHDLAVDQLRETIKLHSWQEALFVEIRYALGAHETLPAGEIAPRIRSLRDALNDITGSILADEPTLASKTLDSCLLDLALGLMTGRVTGVAPDFLVTMREAA